MLTAGVRQQVRLYLLADTGLVTMEHLPAVVASALGGGITLVQLRAKGLTTLQQIDLARELGNLCHTHQVPFVVNDRVDVALASGADGVHVGHIGEEDMHPRDARRLLGGRAIVGVSVGSASEAKAAELAGASYVSAGPMFATTTKPNAGEAAGESLLRAVRAATTLPLVAIGGITDQTAAELRAIGADGVCIGRAILCARDPASVARVFANT